MEEKNVKSSISGSIVNPFKTLVNNIKFKLDVDHIPIKRIQYKDGILIIQLTKDEVSRMNVIENFQYTIVGKFQYG